MSSHSEKLKKQLKGIWVVPEEFTTAFIYIKSENNVIKVKDQTIWLIEEENKRYFRGKSLMILNSIPISLSNFVGSITPEGKVLIDFFSDSGNAQGI